MNSAKPGSHISIAPGNYAGGFYFTDLRGEPGKPIVIAASDPAAPPVFGDAGVGIHLSNPAWVELRHLAFHKLSGNGLNIDDGGSYRLTAHHVVLRGLKISDIGPKGNHDAIKLSGLADFRVEDCTIDRWGGSGIDMVGCHRGVLEGNVFRHGDPQGANGVQCKGGTSEISILRNRFENAGARGVNVGGSTGLNFFRPPLTKGSEHTEAKAIRVEGNTFIGSMSPIAFVGVDGAVIRFNTIYMPKRWALRILQETNQPGFAPCRNGEFTDNLIVFDSTKWSEGGVNIGGGTAPETFKFARNWWFCADRPDRSKPRLPTAELDGTYGKQPLFLDATSGDLRQQPNSPASKVGAEGFRQTAKR